MAENFMKLLMDITLQMQEAQWTPGRINGKKKGGGWEPIPGHIEFKFQKPKPERFLKKSQRRKKILLGANQRIISDFLSETMQEKRKNEIFKALKEK